MRTGPGSVRLPLLVVVCVGILVALLVVVARRDGRESPTNLQRRWARHGVEKPNILLVTLDTTRADHIGCYGYPDASTPAIDALARDGVLFAQAASPAPLTLPAHASIMTGLYPTHHGVRVNGSTALGQAQTTLAEVLSARGYRTGAFIAAFVLDGRWGLSQGFQLYDDQFDLAKFKHLDLAAVQRPGNQVVDAALEWLKRDERGPVFAWVHLYDPHTPYEPPEPFLSAFGPRGPAALYDGEIAFADRQVERLVSWLRSSALDRRTIVVIAGDHGEGLGSHGEGTHGYFVYDYAMHVPLIVAAPFDDLRGIRIEEQVSLVDVFPTVLALAGIEWTSSVHGRSLLPSMLRQDAKGPVYAYGESMSPNLQFGWSGLHSVRSPRYKFIQAPRPELYDLVADPQERTNILHQRAAVASDMSNALKELMAATSRDAPAPEAANLDKETVQRLAALGYVGAPARVRNPSDASGPLADPKDKLAVFTAVQRAGELMIEDQYGAAAEALEAALREEPGMPQALLMLGSCYSEVGRTEDAKAQFDRVLKDDPQSVQALIGMANLLLAEGRTEDVVALARRTLSLDERNTQAYTLLGEVYTDRQEPSRALPYLEKAVEIQPKLTQNRLNLAACLIEVKQFARARATLEEIVAEHPRFPGARFNLGVLHEEEGRPDEARQAYAAEIGSYPDAFKARFNLGKVLAAQGDWAGSIEQMREVVRIAPKRPEGHLFLARGLLHTSTPLDEVQRRAERGLALAGSPEHKALGWFLMADVFSRRQQPERMNEALRHARAQVAVQRGETGDATQRQ